jgi:oligoendopeptidase F
MRRDEDNANNTYQSLNSRAMTLATEYASAASFMAPELLAIPDDRLTAFFEDEPGLALYRHDLDRLRRQRDHVRSSEVEEVLAQVGDLARAPRTVYDMLSNADMRFPNIADEQGKDVELTKGRYLQFIESPDRRVRRDSFLAIHRTYGQFRNTIAATLSSSVRRDSFYSHARRFASGLESALEPENIPLAVYYNLVQTVDRNLPLLQRYMALRKRMLGLDELHMYDLYVPLVPEIEQDIPYDKAVDMVAAGLAPLGSEYITILRQGIADRWIDVYENEGKSPGAYSGGSYNTNPFVLLNYQNNLSSVFTLAHELGHSLHSYYTRHNQPHVYGDYSIFVAEVASTLNEALLTEHLLSNSTDDRLRLYLVNQYLEKFRTTLYRQTMFAEFELAMHQRVEAGEALTADQLCGLYTDLNTKYYAPAVVIDPEIALEWLRIPHFYSQFYVYQYATGISAATALAGQILGQGQTAVDRYVGFLKSGSSLYSIDLLRRAGVDMASPEPVQQAVDVFGGLLDQAEALTAALSAKQASD